MSSPYDMLKSQFCIYCQEDFPSPEKLQNHVLAKHKNTYAYYAIIEARKFRNEVARLKATTQAKPVQWRRVQRPPKRA